MNKIEWTRLFLNKKILTKTVIYRVITFFTGVWVFNSVIGDFATTAIHNLYAVALATIVYYTLEVLFKLYKIKKSNV